MVKIATVQNCLIAYEEAGEGDPSLLCLHGWCGDRSFLHPQLTYFQHRHRVVIPDLPGHGQSSTPNLPLTLPLLIPLLEQFCQQIHLQSPVIVGHSMGGILALLLAAQSQIKPLAIALLDASVPIPATARQNYLDLLHQLRNNGNREGIQELFRKKFFLPTDDAVLRQQIITKMLQVPVLTMISLMESFTESKDLDYYDTALGHYTAPLLYLGSSEPRAELSRLRQLCPQAIVGQVVGSGHFLPLLVPDQVNPMLSRFLELLAA